MRWSSGHPSSDLVGGYDEQIGYPAGGFAADALLPTEPVDRDRGSIDGSAIYAAVVVLDAVCPNPDELLLDVALFALENAAARTWGRDTATKRIAEIGENEGRSWPRRQLRG